jgi:transcription elongation factor GreA
VTGADLIRATGLMPDGPGVLGRPIRSTGPGVFVVELAAPLPRAPIDLAVVGKWIEKLPDLLLDRARPTSKDLVARLAAFWVPSATVLYVGSTERSIAGRVQAIDRHILGDRQPAAASQWLKTLRTDALRVWWAGTDEGQLYEDGLLDAFAAAVPPEERAALFDATVVLPWANLRRPTGERRTTGITGSVVPEPAGAPPPPSRVVELPPGNADGLPEARATGTTRRTNVVPPPARGVRAPRARTPAGRSTRLPASAARPPAEALELTPDGLARLQAELAELTQVKRPAIVDRVARARELGDLKENAEYHSAREEHSFLEGRVQAIEAQLRRGVVVAAGDASRVGLGSRVLVETDGDEMEYTIVGPAESDPPSGRISSVSPVGRALLGRVAGDEALVTTPRGQVRYRIVSIA